MQACRVVWCCLQAVVVAAVIGAVVAVGLSLPWAPFEQPVGSRGARRSRWHLGATTRCEVCCTSALPALMAPPPGFRRRSALARANEVSTALRLPCTRDNCPVAARAVSALPEALFPCR
jgi:hypothetical protein